MNFWFYLMIINFYFLLSNCKKLTCNEIVSNEYINPDFEVNFKLFSIDANKNLAEENFFPDTDFFPDKDSSYFNASLKTIVVIHGFTNNYAWVKLMAEEWLKRVKSLFSVFKKCSS